MLEADVEIFALDQGRYDYPKSVRETRSDHGDMCATYSADDDAAERKYYQNTGIFQITRHRIVMGSRTSRGPIHGLAQTIYGGLLIRLGEGSGDGAISQLSDDPTHVLSYVSPGLRAEFRFDGYRLLSFQTDCVIFLTL